MKPNPFGYTPITITNNATALRLSDGTTVKIKYVAISNYSGFDVLTENNNLSFTKNGLLLSDNEYNKVQSAELLSKYNDIFVTKVFYDREKIKVRLTSDNKNNNFASLSIKQFTKITKNIGKSFYDYTLSKNGKTAYIDESLFTKEVIPLVEHKFEFEYVFGKMNYITHPILKLK
jgi:hypothetical protein